MTTVTDNTTTEKEKTPSTYSEGLCDDHLLEHRQKLNDIVEDQRNHFQELLTEKTANPEKHFLIQQINQWENDSINKIRQVANESRELLLKHINEHVEKIENKLIKLTEELKEVREENNLNEFKEKFEKLKEEFNKPSNISIKESFTPLVCNVYVYDSSRIVTSNSSSDTVWSKLGITVAGRLSSEGNSLYQLAYPYGMSVVDEQTIVVADTSNHRIVEWKKDAKIGQVVAGGNEQGSEINQLNYPSNVIIDKENDSLIISDYGNQRVMRWPRRKSTNGEILISNVNCWDLAMDKDGYLYISDVNNHEVRRWKIGDTNGILVAGGNGQGNRLDQLNKPHHIFVDQDCSVYITDNENHRIMKWIKDAKEGIIVAGGQGEGDALNQLSYPLGVIVDQSGSIYIADSKNDRIMRWLKGAKEGSIIMGGHLGRVQLNQFNYPVDLSFDQYNNLYILDYFYHRVLKFAVGSYLLPNYN